MSLPHLLTFAGDQKALAFLFIFALTYASTCLEPSLSAISPSFVDHLELLGMPSEVISKYVPCQKKDASVCHASLSFISSGLMLKQIDHLSCSPVSLSHSGNFWSLAVHLSGKS